MLGSIVDVMSTCAAITHGATELNPVGAWLLDHGGCRSLWASKILFLGILALVSLAPDLPQWYPRWLSAVASVYACLSIYELAWGG
ncbi:MAG: DUF5658 family protein [Gammaproteobacteria bacterium]